MDLGKEKKKYHDLLEYDFKIILIEKKAQASIHIESWSEGYF